MKKTLLLIILLVSFIACNDRTTQENKSLSENIILKIITEDNKKIILKSLNDKIIKNADYITYVNFIKENPNCALYDNGSDFKYLYKNIENLKFKSNNFYTSKDVGNPPNIYGYFNLYSEGTMIYHQVTNYGLNGQVNDLSQLNINNKTESVVASNCQVTLFKNKNFSFFYNDDYPQSGPLITNNPEKDAPLLYIIDAKNGKNVTVNFPKIALLLYDSWYYKKTSSLKWEGSAY